MAADTTGGNRTSRTAPADSAKDKAADTKAANPPETLANEANPTGADNVSTGPVGDAQVIDAQEHVLGDDPRRVAHRSGYHDSLTGRAVTSEGEFTDGTAGGPIPHHRIVADNWPTERDQIDDATQREGNQAPSK